MTPQRKRKRNNPNSCHVCGQEMTIKTYQRVQEDWELPMGNMSSGKSIQTSHIQHCSVDPTHSVDKNYLKKLTEIT